MRHNNVYLCGLVDIPPKVVIDEKTGDYTYVMGRVVTMRCSRPSGDPNKNKLDCPLVYTHNQGICAEMSSWKHGDLVLIHGVLATKDINKTRSCPNCGEKIKTPGTMTYVNPIYCQKLDAFGDDAEMAKRKLKLVKEMSNNVTILGMTCRELQLFRKGNNPIASYQMAIKRKYHDRMEDDSIKVDFPFVKSYANVATSDANMLKKGSYILLDGFIQARTFKRKETCPKCNHEFEWTDCSQEVVPFAVEYLQNYITDEERSQQAQKTFKAVFGKKSDEEALIEQESKPEDIQEIIDALESHKVAEAEFDDEPKGPIKLSDLT